MEKRKAVYAASLDPITNGHLNVIERMAPFYDELIVLIAVDPRKTYTFSPEERVNMAKAAIAHLPNVHVDVCVGRYVVKQADSIGAQIIIRGLRNFKDLEDEQTLAEENRRICPGIETIWVPCLPHLMHVSSSMVKSHVGIDPEWEEQVARSVPPAVIVKLKEKLIFAKAQKHWTALMSALGSPKGSDIIFKDLLVRYSEPHRVYHILEHIVAMLDCLNTINEAEQEIMELALAIWFHDAVYDTKTRDNEEQSALLAKEASGKLGLPDAFGEQVSNLVLATKHTAGQPDRVAQIMGDLDLAIFGKSEKEFDTYEIGVRKEYAEIPYPDFAATRSKILQSFLDRPSIYLTHHFREMHELTARKNLKRSIEQLKK